MKILFAALAILISFSIGSAQNIKTIEGTVFYKESNEPVPFAYVKIADDAYGTVTDAQGKFRLVIPEKYFNATLEFSYVGLKKYGFLLKNYSSPIRVFMETDVTQLKTLVITGEREVNAQSLLKKALKSVSDNFVNEPFNAEGYYREYVTENDAPVKYADAVFQLELEGYTGKEPKRKHLEKPYEMSGITTIGSWTSRASSLHRWHFHQAVLKGEKANIVESKSSDDLNTTRLYANIQGGPLSAYTKDRVKYPAEFLSDFNKYDYKAQQVEIGKEIFYEVTFTPSTSTESFGKKRFPFNDPNKLAGTILIRKSDLAITEIKYSVPPEYKEFICGYRGRSVRHFDFAVEARYEKLGPALSLTYLKHTDEFIVEDTLQDTRVPYKAISELYVRNTNTGESLSPISEEDNFSNSDYSYLFDLPEGYNDTFWSEYEQLYPNAQVPKHIVLSMSKVRPLVDQFRYKLTRDTTLLPPVAPKIPSQWSLHGQNFTDDYAWMKDTRNPLGNEPLMNHLAAENAYVQNYVRPLKPLQRELMRELRSYIQEDYTSLPTKEGDYAYYYTYTPEDEYPRYYRKLREENAEPELLFDVNEMAKDQAFYAFGGLQPSPSAKLAVYSENTTGNDKWVVKIKNLETGEILRHQINYVGGIVWLNDSILVFTKTDPKTFRSYSVWRFDLTTGQETWLYTEENPEFSLGLGRTRSRQYVYFNAGASDQNEIWFLPVSDPFGEFQLIAPRREEHQYSFDHAEDKFYFLTNHKAPNKRLMTTDTAHWDEKSWKEYVPEDEEVELLSFYPMKRYHIFQERHELKYKIRVLNLEDGKSYYIPQYGVAALYMSPSEDFDTDTLRVRRMTYHLPARVYDYNLAKKKWKALRWDGKMTGLISAKEETVYATAKDGTRIPITLIYSKQALKNRAEAGKKPLLYMTGYGSYGASYTAGYNPNITPLVQNGFVYAIAHVRGGADLGDEWYKDGKLLNKKNTFTDFIACTEFLISEGYGEKGNVVAEGGSAGGLLMGAIANMRPDLYKLLVLDVPFVDVVNTMLDDKLPLTTGEYKEWGNPNEKKYFNYISSYSPYDNVKAQDYPNLLFFTGINDSRVGYWEPAKMVAKLREMKTDDNEILLQVDFSSGHGGASGRYASLAKSAMKYAIVLDMLSEK